MNMGQKVNPIGLRLGINRTWDSRWYADRGLCRPAARGPEAPRLICTSAWPRPASAGSSSSGRRRRPRITIHTARPGVVIGKKGADIEKLRDDLPKMTGVGGPPQHRRDPQAGDRRQAGGREHRPAARAPRCLPPRHEAGGAVGDAPGRPGHPDQLRRPARRRGDRADGVVSRRPRAAAHAARRRRFRHGNREDHLWHLRREGLGLQGRDPGARPDGAGQATRRAAGWRARAI